MTEHGILFSGEMVRALLDNRKTRTRRLSRRWLRVKAGDRLWVRETWWEYKSPELHQAAWEVPGSGTRCLFPDGGTHDEPEKEIGGRIWHPSQFPAVWRKRPSIHMPRWASRITLEATEDARLERLQDITEEEARAEGVASLPPAFDRPDERFRAYNDPELGWHCSNARDSFVTLWESLRPKPGERWSDNPEVPVLSFRRLA